MNSSWNPVVFKIAANVENKDYKLCPWAQWNVIEKKIMDDLIKRWPDKPLKIVIVWNTKFFNASAGAWAFMVWACDWKIGATFRPLSEPLNPQLWAWIEFNPKWEQMNGMEMETYFYEFKRDGPGHWDRKLLSAEQNRTEHWKKKALDIESCSNWQ